MKKYLLGFTAVALAVVFSSFTKPFVSYTMKLTVSPIAANRVNTETNWKDNGSLYGICSGTQQDLACTITADEKYTHDVSGVQVLNTSGDTPAGEAFLTVTEATGLLDEGVQYYKIASITASDNTTSFSFVNAVH